MIPKIKVGICIAYDWEMLKIALPIIYNEVDEICLSLDINRQTWAGNEFQFDEVAFYQYVKLIDKYNKIIVYEDDFYKDKESTMYNEVYQRNKIADKLGKLNSWHIQIDVDEYFVDIKSIVYFLKNNYDKFKDKDVNICLPFYIMFKQINHGNLFIKGRMEWVPVITNNPNYEFGRRNGYFNYKFDSAMIHQSWARSETEIQQKICNWGHKNDFDVQDFFQRWKKLNADNYTEWTDFHPINGAVWHELILIKGETIDELLEVGNRQFEQLKTYSSVELLIKNSRLFSKVFQMVGIKW